MFQPGQAMLTALPPNLCARRHVRGKCAMTWSAMITEIGDRDQRLPQILAHVPAQKQLLHNQSDEPMQTNGDERRVAPTPRW